jgi:hypothetical protein
MGSSLLAFRPASAVHRLGPRSEACPLSLREVARGLADGAPPALIVAAPHPAVARAALMAAKGARAAVGIALPGGAEPDPWFAAVAQAADDLAPRLPFFACADVAVAGGDDAAIDAAFAAAHRLVEAGVTHLAVDVAAVPLARRAEAAARVAGIAAERELAVDCLLPPGALDPDDAVAYVEEFEGFGVRADVVSVRCAAPADPGAAAAEARALAEARVALGRPLVRRGTLTDAAARAARVAGLFAAEDGGRAVAAGARAARAAGEDRAAAAARLEALAYAEIAALLEAIGAVGSALAVEAALLGRR